MEYFLRNKFVDPKQDIVTGATEYEGYNWKGVLERADGKPDGHVALRDLPKRLPDLDLRGYFIFTVEREPMRKTISHWNFLRSRNLVDPNISLRDFVRTSSHIPSDWHKYTMTDYFGEHNRCDHVFQFTDLWEKPVWDVEIPKRLEDIGFTNHCLEDLRLISHKKHTKQTDEEYLETYRQNVTPEIFNIIRAVFNKEIEHYGY